MKLARLALLLLSSTAIAQLAPPPPAPTQAQPWVKIVSSEDSAERIDLPAGASIRWCDAATGKTCSPVEAFTAPTTIYAYCPLVPQCSAADPTDGLSAITKDVEVLATTASQTVLLDDSPTIIPALPAPQWPAFSFVPGTSYWVLVTYLPPNANGQAQGQVKLYNGNTLVSVFVCTSGTVMITPPAGAAAATPPTTPAAPFGCVAQPVTTQ